MRNMIKILIALIFIICSFLLGKYSNNEKTYNKLENTANLLQIKVDALVILNSQLVDSITILQNQIDFISSKSSVIDYEADINRNYLVNEISE